MGRRRDAALRRHHSAAQRRGAGVRRRGLPRRLPAAASSTSRTRSSRSSSSTTARPTGPASSPTGSRPGTPGSGCPPGQRRPRSRTQRGVRRSHRRLPRVRRQRRPGGRRGLRRHGRLARAHGLRHRDRRGGAASRAPRRFMTPLMKQNHAETAHGRRDRRGRRCCSPTSSRGTRSSAARSGTRADLAFPEDVRYEDQPTLTRALVARSRFDVLAEPVYLWRVRTDGTLDQPAARRPARPLRPAR